MNTLSPPRLGGDKATLAFKTTFQCQIGYLEEPTILTHVSRWKRTDTVEKLQNKYLNPTNSPSLVGFNRGILGCIRQRFERSAPNMTALWIYRLKPTMRHEKWIQMFVSQRINKLSVRLSWGHMREYGAYFQITNQTFGKWLNQCIFVPSNPRWWQAPEPSVFIHVHTEGRRHIWGYCSPSPFIAPHAILALI